MMQRTNEATITIRIVLLPLNSTNDWRKPEIRIIEPKLKVPKCFSKSKMVFRLSILSVLASRSALPISIVQNPAVKFEPRCTEYCHVASRWRERCVESEAGMLSTHPTNTERSRRRGAGAPENVPAASTSAAAQSSRA